jgi:chromosome segregation ATPase
VAYNYIKAEEQKQQSEVDLKTARESINSTKNDASEIKQVMADEEEMIKELYKEKAGSDSEGQQRELELQVESLSKDVALAESTLKDNQHHLTEENKNCNQLKKSLAEVKLILW